MKRYKTLDGEIFDSFSEALDWLEQYSLPNPEEQVEEIEVEEETLTKTEETKESTIEETPEEPDEESAIEEKTLQDFVNYQNLSETDKAIFMQKALGGQKKLPKRVMIKNFDTEFMQRFVDKIKMGSCPICDEHWSRLTDKPDKDAPELKTRLILSHIEKLHPDTYAVLKKSFIPVKPPHAAAPFSPNPEGSVEMPKHMTRPLVIGHGQEIPTEAENLSADQSEILDDKKFLETLSKKTEKGYDLTEKERQRFLHLFKRLKGTK